jgi:addiction module HigA family antidote
MIIRLDALDAARSLDALRQPGFDSHALPGSPQRYSIHVNGPWCITFEWETGRVLRVDPEQYQDRRMTELSVRRPIARAPSHPGELLGEILQEHVKIPVAAAAHRMKISRQSLHAVLSGDASVTAEMALRFARLVGGEPELHLEMQAQRDLWHARLRLRDTLADIEPVA